LSSRPEKMQMSTESELLGPVDRLVDLRRRAQGDALTDALAWLSDDPVISFVAPILWHLRDREGPRADWEERRYWTAEARFARLRHRLLAVVGTLRDAGLPVVVLKGALLAETLYDSPAYRLMTDLDLLVRHRDLDDALECLELAGWGPSQGRERSDIWEWVGRQDVERSWQTGSLTLTDEDSYLLDLHWHIVPDIWMRPAYRVDMDAVWERARPLEQPGLEGAFSLSPVHTLAHLCLHVAEDGLYALRSLLDIDRLIRLSRSDPGWNWEAFIACVSRWRMCSAAFHALRAAAYLFDSPVPSAVFAGLDPGPAAKARVAALIRPEHLLEHPPSALGRRYPRLVTAVLVDRSVDLMRILWRTAWPSPMWRKARYGSEGRLIDHWRHAMEVVTGGDSISLISIIRHRPQGGIT
jgi:hypothetical protein